jgi:hypothetical protein
MQIIEQKQLKRWVTMYKNNSGYCAKLKVCIFVLSSVIN